MENLPEPLKAISKATLSKAADKFVDFVITKYTGKSIKVFEAEGDIEADKVKTKWELLEKPFWLQAEAAKMGRQYANLGNTLVKSSPYIVSDENKISNDNDFFWGVIEHAKSISDDEMQELIAKIIAGEYNTPGAYNMSTLQAIKVLGRNEMRLFESACGLIVNRNQIPIQVFRFSDDKIEEVVKSLGVDYEKLSIMQGLGLFLPGRMTASLKGVQGFELTYFDKKILFHRDLSNAKNPDGNINLPGFYSLSPAGQQILQHLNPKYNDDYFQWIKQHYEFGGFKVVSKKE